MLAIACFAFLFSSGISALNATKPLISASSCVQLYEKGVEAYLENDFEGCVRYLEGAVKNYRRYNEVLQNCRIECGNEAKKGGFLFSEDVEDLHFYERILRNTLCILKCRKNQFVHGEYNLNPETEAVFKARKPYEYLQLCYFQVEQYQKCASAAFTYLVYHPDDEVMLTNLKYYSKLPGVDVNDIINFEANDYVYFYVHGSDAYTHKDWEAVIQNMEESITSYLQAEDECRAACEGPFDQGWYPDFVPSIANHFTFCLRCKRDCPKSLSSLNGEIHDDLFPSHYHYLQFAYFKVQKLKEACEAVASYLLFYPNDEVMLSNKDYYGGLKGVKEEWFRPRKEASRYFKRDTYEKKLYKFIMSEFSDQEDESKKVEDSSANDKENAL